jgi:hypothetical protein
MGRRYLTVREVDFALRSGRLVEAFIGAGETTEVPSIRFICLRGDGKSVTLSHFEVEDLRPDLPTDPYEFPAIKSENVGEPDEEHLFTNWDDCLSFIRGMWPGVDQRLVNFGLIADEYADFLNNKGA